MSSILELLGEREVRRFDAGQLVIHQGARTDRLYFPARLILRLPFQIEGLVSPVFVRFGKSFVIVSLVAMLGAHWALLQTVAWTTMLADNLQSGSFHDAVTKTFDGQHPCPICKAVAAGKQSEQKTEFTPELKKLEFPTAPEKPALFAPTEFELLPLTNISAEAFAPQPPVPPPRSFFA